MTIDVVGWPVVHMHFAGQIDEAEFVGWMRRTSALLARQQPFSIVTSSAADMQLPANYRQLEAVWYKANKAVLGQYCLGLARLASSDEQYQHLNGKAMHNAWPCAYFVSLSLDQAMTWAKQQLVEQ
ncbi:MAG: hypothetical protein VXW65_11980 [Pseudomonadota bacterium]|nr:hypothetical protein [Pseudomonadota bacterium]